MSGIVGIYYLDGRPVEQMDVQRMLDSIAHRGPDGSGVWIDGSVGLGHRMLWTTPESLHEKLPLTNKSGDLTITADARIDNRDELIPALNLNGRPRETIPDSEIILAAYEKWGEKCPEKLLGDFSFAIWDKRQQQIYCARDPIGIKPFFYYFKDGKFRWSSEPKAIFEDKTIPKEPNLPLICLYLLNRFDEREETLYKDVYRLPPSHFMVLEDWNGKIRKGQYWDIDPKYLVRYKTDAEYAEHFLTLFKEAVRVHLRNDGPVGTLLSGGLDSSSIVSMAQMLYQEGILVNKGFETFSIVFDKLPCDERQYIYEVAHKWTVRTNYFTYERHLSSMDFEQIYQNPDVGYVPTLLFFTPALTNAHQKGIKVMLNGIGGDDLLTRETAYLGSLLLRGRLREIIRLLNLDSTTLSSSRSLLFFNHCLKPLIASAMRATLKVFFHKNGVPAWISKDYVRRAGIDKPKNRVRKPKSLPSFQQQIYDDLYFGWNINVAIERIDRFLSQFGIESRYPFFYRPLVEFCLTLPKEQRRRRQYSKSILRQSMEGILPEIVRSRKDKVSFFPVIESELCERQRDKLEELFGMSFFSNSGMIRFGRLRQLLQDHLRGSINDDFRDALETIVWLEIWVRSITGRLVNGGGNDGQVDSLR